MIPRGHFTRVVLVLALAAVALALLLAPGQALAQEQKEDVSVRVNGTVNLAADERVDILVAVDSPAQVAGTVRDTLVIVNGTATISGDIGRDAIVFNGTLQLEPTAQIGGDVVLINGELSRADGAVIGGSVVERSWTSVGAELGRVTAAVSFVAWLGMSLLLIIVALGWAAIGGQQLSSIAGLLGARPGLTAGVAAIFWVAVPIVAIVAFVTVIGIPLAAFLALLAPLLWILGYVTAGTRLGFFIADLRHTMPDLTHPYLEAVLGVVILQLIGLIPVVGGIVVALAGLLGAGAIVVHIARRISNPRNYADAPPLDAAA
jgi:cytoskeletal protein CcmA (bactofilin family)